MLRPRQRPAGVFRLPSWSQVSFHLSCENRTGFTVVQGATDAAGRRGVALARAAAIEGPGSSGWLRLEIILDSDTYRYLGARHVVTRDQFIPNVGGPKGTWNRKGQVLVSRAQLALAVVNAPCQRPGETTTGPPRAVRRRTDHPAWQPGSRLRCRRRWRRPKAGQERRRATPPRGP
jgi:hypothetical protein